MLDDAPLRGRPAAFFDLDKTIIAKSSTLAFSRKFYEGGLLSRRSALRSAYAQIVFHAGGADHAQMERMRQQISAMVTGWSVGTVREIVAETLHLIVDPLVFDEAVDLIEEHHALGRDVVIVSTSGAEVVEPIGAMLGADETISTRMVERAGRYTGEIEFYAFGSNKAAAMRELAARRGYDLARSYAYSDSITDLPMLDAVGVPHAVNPDRALKREALARGWPILDFRRRVPLRSRVRLDARHATLAALTVGAAATAIAAAAWAVRHRARGDVRVLTVTWPRQVTGR